MMKNMTTSTVWHYCLDSGWVSSFTNQCFFNISANVNIAEKDKQYFSIIILKMCWCFRPPGKESDGGKGRNFQKSKDLTSRNSAYILFCDNLFQSSFQYETSHPPQNCGVPLAWKRQGRKPWYFPLPDSLCIPGDNNCFWGCLQSLTAACWACQGLRLAWRTSMILQRPHSPQQGLFTCSALEELYMSLFLQVNL